MFKQVTEYLQTKWILLNQYMVESSGINSIINPNSESYMDEQKWLILILEWILDRNEQFYQITHHNELYSEIEYITNLEQFYYSSVNKIFIVFDYIKNGIISIFFVNSQIILLNIDVYGYIIICLLVLYAVYLNNFQNKYTVYKIFIIIIITMYMILYKSTNVYLIFFIILTELFSVYLILLITAKINKIIFKYNNNYIYIYIYLLLYNTNNIYLYTYFDYYSTSLTNHTNYAFFLIIFKTHYIYILLSLLILLTLLILNFFLTKTVNDRKINIYMLWSNLYLLMNKTANNLNLYIDNFIFKWR